jgi:hypothetical protein
LFVDGWWCVDWQMLLQLAYVDLMFACPFFLLLDLVRQPSGCFTLFVLYQGKTKNKREKEKKNRKSTSSNRMEVAEYMMCLLIPLNPPLFLSLWLVSRTLGDFWLIVHHLKEDLPTQISQ